MEARPRAEIRSASRASDERRWRMNGHRRLRGGDDAPSRDSRGRWDGSRESNDPGRLTTRVESSRLVQRVREGPAPRGLDLVGAPTTLAAEAVRAVDGLAAGRA